MKRFIYTILCSVILSFSAQAQHATERKQPPQRPHSSDTASLVVKPSTVITSVVVDTVWHPNPRKATLLSAAFPGFGQIYNKQWWKVPVIYVGMGTLGYFVSWNHQRYVEYKNAYIDFTDDDPTSNRYLLVVEEGYEIPDDDWFATQLENGKDSYRRDRDLLVFSLVGVYVLNILEANVAAHLHDFDVSDDLTLNLQPHLNYDLYQRKPFLGMSLTFSLNK